MLILTRYARVGRNHYQTIRKGKVTIEDSVDGRKIILDVKDEQIVKFSSIKSGGSEREEVEYGKSIRRFIGKKLVEKIRLRRGSNRAKVLNGEYKTVDTKLGQYKGKLVQKCYGGSMRQEKFTYANGKLAYNVYAGQKRGKVLRPNGKVWFEWEGRLAFAFAERVLCGTGTTFSVHRRKDVKCDTALFRRSGEQDYHNLFRSRGWRADEERVKITLYASNGKIIDRCEYRRGQKEGECVERGYRAYYIQGVGVSGKIFKSKPEELNVQEVLDITNVQLRASLLSKIGYTRVLKEMKATELDRKMSGEHEEYVLYSSPLKDTNTRGGDTEMKILKMRCPSTGAYYVERVHPLVKTIKEAIAWQNGSNFDTQGKIVEHLEIVKAT